MENVKTIRLILDKDLDYALTMHLLNLRRASVKTTKADLIIKLMRIGLLKESAELIKEERNQ
jgi:hypothetical protein